ncbi:MAG: sigma-70 family RNA polymerase sigma factor [Geminicoccaceae bacterium]
MRLRVQNADDLSDGDGLEALLLATARGDKRAFQQLYDETAPRLLAIAIRIMGARDLAEDVIHDAFVKIWSAAGSFDPDRGSAKAWLNALVRHRCIDLLRRAHPIQQDLDEVNEPAFDPTPEMIEQISVDQQKSRLFVCLQQLESNVSRAIAMAFFDGCTHEQIAQRMALPLGTIKSRIRRGLMALKLCIER